MLPAIEIEISQPPSADRRYLGCSRPREYAQWLRRRLRLPSTRKPPAPMATTPTAVAATASVPVKASPELDPDDSAAGAGAAPSLASALTMLIPAAADLPAVSVPVLVLAPTAMPLGMVTTCEKLPLASAVAVPRPVPPMLSATEPGVKLTPVTVSDCPSLAVVTLRLRVGETLPDGRSRLWPRWTGPRRPPYRQTAAPSAGVR